MVVRERKAESRAAHQPFGQELERLGEGFLRLFQRILKLRRSVCFRVEKIGESDLGNLGTRQGVQDVGHPLGYRITIHLDLN